MSKKTIKLGDQVYTVLFPDLLRPLTPDERAGLKASIEKDGILNPVVCDGDYGVIDGINRLEILAELYPQSKPYFHCHCYRNLKTLEEKRELALSLNLNRRHLTPQEQQEARTRRVERVVEARQAGKSIRAIAEQEKVSVAQVQRDLANPGVPGDTLEPETEAAAPVEAAEPKVGLQDTGSAPPQTTPSAPTTPASGKVVGRDGKTYQAKSPPRKAPKASPPAKVASSTATTAPTRFRWSDLKIHGSMLGHYGSRLCRLGQMRVADRNTSPVLALLSEVRSLADMVERELAKLDVPCSPPAADQPADAAGGPQAAGEAVRQG